jgi:hypothetical protein
MPCSQFPSPYGDDATGTAPGNPANGGDNSFFLLPVPKVNPSVTVGVAIVKPTNTLYGPLPGNNTAPSLGNPTTSSSSSSSDDTTTTSNVNALGGTNTPMNDALAGKKSPVPAQQPVSSPTPVATKAKNSGAASVVKVSSLNGAPQPVRRAVPLSRKAPAAPVKASPAPPHKSPAVVAAAAVRRPASPRPRAADVVKVPPSSAQPAPKQSSTGNAPVVLTGNASGKQVVVNKPVLPTAGANRRLLAAP